MTRVLMVTLLLALAFTVTACGGSTTRQRHECGPANITMWTPFVDPELQTLKAVVRDFEAKHPGIHVKVVGTNDDKIVAAIRGGNAPDVAQSFSSDNTGAFCPSGAWADLACTCSATV
jgi:multiple sugar transport system substrate-binding protein